MKNSAVKREFNKDENWKAIDVSVSVIGLSGSYQLKGSVGVGKSSICNRLVRPDHYSQKQFSTLSQVDFHSDIFAGSNWIYWDYSVQTVDAKDYAFHVIEQTVLISDQTFLPFDNDSENDYVSRAVSDKVFGIKRAFTSTTQLSRSQGFEALSTTEQQSSIDAFILVFDVSEVNSRDYQAQDRYVSKLLTALHKTKKPIVIALSKFDMKSQKIKSRFDSIMEKHNWKSIPIIETSAYLNINISLIPAIVISEINQHHSRSLSINLTKKQYKFQTFDEALLVKKREKEAGLRGFRQLVNVEVMKTYELTWDVFSSNNELCAFTSVFDKSELVNEFARCKTDMVEKINESLMTMFVVLFKKLLFEFISPILDQESSGNENVLQNLLQNPDFIQQFQQENVDEFTIFRTAHLTKTIDFPIPRFLINDDNPLNKLYLVDSVIEEIKFQRIQRNFEKELLTRLEANVELYEDMKFVEVETNIKDLPLLNHFRDLAATIFSTFISHLIGQFKVLFDERLLELSFMIFMCMPVKTCMTKYSLKEKCYKETLPDMDLIHNIDNKIFFEHNKFDKEIYRKQRINWVVRYIGSLITSDPRNCYHFDFNSAMCHNNLLKYLHPFKVAVRDIVAVISLDRTIDTFWKRLTDNKSIVIDDTFSSGVEFISSDELVNEKPQNRLFSPCQKLIILTNDSQNNVDQIIERLFNNHLNYPDQVSFINLESFPVDSDPQQLNLMVTRVNDHCNNIEDNVYGNNTLMTVIKNQTISYLCQKEAIYIWFIVLCDDTYDRNIPVIFFLSLFDDCVILERQDDTSSVASISIVYYPAGEDIPQRINVTILSYHQAFKLLNDKCQDFTPHLLLFFADMNRLASINTLFAIIQNLLTVVCVKSVLCSIKTSNFLDTEEFINRKKMILRLAFDHRVLSVMIEAEQGIQQSMASDNEDISKLRSLINECVHVANYYDDNKNLCNYNHAYETEDVATARTARSYVTNGHCNSEINKEKSVTGCQDDVCQQSSFGSQDRTFSNSDSIISPDITSSDLFFSQVDGITTFSKIEIVDSESLGYFNEHLFRAIEEENGFCDVVQDTSTIIQVNCTNIKHIGLSRTNQVKRSPDNQQNSKFRSFSGPVQVNKSFSRKYCTAQNPFNRSQRYSSKKSQSLTTSPVTSYMKSYSHNQISSCNCKGSDEHCLSCPITSLPLHNPNGTASKSIKSAISRLFSSDRCTNKSAEERRSIFGRSFKFTKKNADKKPKNIPATNLSSEGLCNRCPSSSVLLPSHSSTVSVADTRNRTKSISKTVFSL